MKPILASLEDRVWIDLDDYSIFWGELVGGVADDVWVNNRVTVLFIALVTVGLMFWVFRRVSSRVRRASM